MSVTGIPNVKLRRQIFVFGSNLAGHHGAGAAKKAMQEYGAIYGQANGLQGNSYAIPTKTAGLLTLPIDAIKHRVDQFLRFAEANPEIDFFVTRVGSGLADHTSRQMAALFKGHTPNVKLDPSYARWLEIDGWKYSAGGDHGDIVDPLKRNG